MATQALLAAGEIRQACDAIRLAFGAVAKLRKDAPGGKFVQYPKIPSIVSESWLAQEVAYGRAPFWPAGCAVSRGGTACDLQVLDPHGRIWKLEVKATGSAAFQFFSTKDVTADALAWLSFDRYFEAESHEPPTVFWLENPSAVFAASTKITLREFRRRCGDRLHETTLLPMADP